MVKRASVNLFTSILACLVAVLMPRLSQVTRTEWIRPLVRLTGKISGSIGPGKAADAAALAAPFLLRLEEGVAAAATAH